MVRRYVYLGRRVPDIGARGLDRATEVRGIADAILADYMAGRTSYRRTMSRLNLLELIVQRDRSFSATQKRTLRAYIDRVRQRLRLLKK